jgi:hypothetical protein
MRGLGLAVMNEWHGLEQSLLRPDVQAPQGSTNDRRRPKSAGRRRWFTGAVTMIAASMLVTSGAAANSLLSGYGGPGQGEQALLGGGLVGGPSGGPPSGGSGTTTSLRSAQARAGAGENARTGSSASPATHAPRTHAVSGRSSGNPKEHAPGRVRSHSSSYPYPAARLSSSNALDFSGEDLLYVLLAITGLAVTAAFTRRLARSAG